MDLPPLSISFWELGSWLLKPSSGVSNSCASSAPIRLGIRPGALGRGNWSQEAPETNILNQKSSAAELEPFVLNPDPACSKFRIRKKNDLNPDQTKNFQLPQLHFLNKIKNINILQVSQLIFK
jgi:hypothetical protein